MAGGAANGTVDGAYGNLDTVFRAWREAGGNRFNFGLAFSVMWRAPACGEVRGELDDYDNSGLVSVWRHHA